MILKGSQRAGPRQLALHLLSLADNDHVTVQEIRGFVSTELHEAMTETVAIARGTKCRQPIFSLSVNPPKNTDASLADIMQAIERIEPALGLTNQPRAIVVHEKEGRRHAHVVWSRIDHAEMKAINLPFYKLTLKEMSKELYLQHDWPLPEGHRTNGWKNPLNFTLAEWQQAKRQGLDARELKHVFKEAWERSDSLDSFRNALEERGIYLAKGDRRGIVGTDLHGEVYSVARWTDLKTKDLNAKLGKGERLPRLAEIKADLENRGAQQLRKFIIEDRKLKQAELLPFRQQLLSLVAKQRMERQMLDQMQRARWQKETVERAARFRTGIGVLLDVFSGRLLRERKKNEAEAYAAFVRDRAQREQLFLQQARERAPIEQKTERIKRLHIEQRRVMASRVAKAIKYLRSEPRSFNKPRDRELGL